jgi:hypothetical protein
MTMIDFAIELRMRTVQAETAALFSWAPIRWWEWPLKVDALMPP